MDAGLERAEQMIEEARTSGAKELYLSYLSLPQLPESLFELTQLEELILSGNELSSLPSEIDRLHHLKILDLAGNQLSELPASLSRLTQLVRLDLASNQLRDLPADISALAHLEYLDVYANQITQLPDGITDCRHLSTLRLADNELTKLPIAFGNLSKLEILELSNNELHGLPESIHQLEHLKELRMNGNLLNIPFYHLSKLVHHPADLLNIYAEIKQEEEQKQRAIEAEQQQQLEYTQEVQAWVKDQQARMAHYDWQNGIRYQITIPGNPDLPKLQASIEQISHTQRILDYLFAKRNDENEQAKIEGLLSELEGLPRAQEREEMLARISRRLPLNEEDQQCQTMRFESKGLGAKDTLQIEISAPKNKRQLAALFLSCQDMLFERKDISPEICIKALSQQLESLRASSDDSEQGIESLARGIFLLRVRPRNAIES